MSALPTKSQFLIKELQTKYGSANFKKWQSIRRQFYSFVQYTNAGVSELRFFGSAISSTVNRQLTNMPKANSFGQNHFLLKAIRTGYYIPSHNLGRFGSGAASVNITDADTMFSEIAAGLFQAGVFELSIGARQVVQVPKPFLYMPPSDGRAQVKASALSHLVQIEAAPPTYTAAALSAAGVPHAELSAERGNLYMVDPNIVIEAEQNFDCVIRYPSGALAPIASSVINDTTNKLFVGVIFDGLIFRPQQ